MSVRILIGDCRDVLRTLPDESVHCVVTSPPYFGLRDYGVAGQIGLESTPDEYVAALVGIFRQVRRVLRPDGTCFLNLGDSYASSTGMKTTTPLKPKDLIGIPWRVAFALQADGWYLRQDIIWSKPNPMPESVTDRCTKAHEYLFLLSKSERYYYDAPSIVEPAAFGFNGSSFTSEYDRATKAGLGTTERIDRGTRNKRSVWEIATSPYSGAHFATFPPALIEPCIKAGCPVGGIVLDPFGGAGTTALVADRLQCDSILIEINPDYAVMAEHRIRNDAGLMAEIDVARTIPSSGDHSVSQAKTPVT